jgi:hypothetical protein
MTERTPRLVGGIHRDITGRADEPLRFFLSIDRGLKSGRIESVKLREEQILGLVKSGVAALELLAKERSA